MLKVVTGVFDTKVICRSDTLIVLDDRYSIGMCGNVCIGVGDGVFSCPMAASPWYADTKRLYPLMWAQVLNGGCLDFTFLARAFHRSCVS